MPEQYTPKVNAAKELAEISKDFTNPRELIRETISNSIDASAGCIWIEATRDHGSGEDELLLRIYDNGTGMTREVLEGFFDLGFSTKRDIHAAIGEKGHGTKIVYNSSEVIVYSRSIETGEMLKASMFSPKRSLALAVTRNQNPPPVEFDRVEISGVDEFDRFDSGTLIELRGYDSNNYKAFAHLPLQDYIHWFTAWGRIHGVWGIVPNPECKLFLKGIGSDVFEEIPYGHPFPAEAHNFGTLRTLDERRPENFFVQRWDIQDLPVVNHPDKRLSIVMSIEGDSAKRGNNPMLKRLGRRAGAQPDGNDQYRYNVGDRYGIYYCKDFIPVERKNNLFSTKSEWTHWHAFVNCQGFHLTANRASVENTPADLLDCIRETVDKYLQECVFDSEDYREFAFRIKIEEGRRKASKERADVVRRHNRYRSKKFYRVNRDDRELNFLEPMTEQGVLWLTSKLALTWPEHFPWINAIDLDEHFGYDILVSKHGQDLRPEDMAFVELKYKLRDSDDFNHSYEHLSAIVCWDANLERDRDHMDIAGQARRFVETAPTEEYPYSRFALVDLTGGNSVKVISLLRYLQQQFQLTELNRPNR